MNQYTCLTLFSGLGGGALGFQRAGFELIGGIDYSADACSDYRKLTGSECTEADVADMSPEDLRAVSGGRVPDVVITSPPCKASTRNLPQRVADTEHYQKMMALAERGVWLLLEAFADDPPPLVLLENVPSITQEARGREWLDAACSMLEAYGYAVSMRSHCCGKIGGLAQRRERLLLMARHTGKVSPFLLVPPERAMLGVGDVLEGLPIPGEGGGPLHELPELWDRTWMRLAAIPAGGDYRDLPEELAIGCPVRIGSYGVCAWDGSTHAVIASPSPHNTSLQVADPRVTDFEVDEGDWASRQGGVRHFEGVSGAWHRPMTLLELARLQGLPAKVDGDWLTLAGSSRAGWAERIGNAIPVGAAEAIALECKRVLDNQGTWSLAPADAEIWVEEVLP